MPEAFVVTELIPVSPERLYAAWLDANEHAAFTGGRAESDARLGGRFSAWDDYIQGSYMDLADGTRIVMSWRTVEFPPEAPDSRLEVELVPTEGGTLLTLRHSEIPEGQGASYQQGWSEHYFEPLKAYFSGGMKQGEAEVPSEQAAPPPPAKKAPPKRAAAKKAAPKRAAAKQAAPKRAAAKKAAPKRAAAKKQAPKRGAAKKAPKRGAAKKSPKRAAAGKAPKRATKKAARTARAATRGGPKRARTTRRSGR